MGALCVVSSYVYRFPRYLIFLGDRKWNGLECAQLKSISLCDARQELIVSRSKPKLLLEAAY